MDEPARGGQVGRHRVDAQGPDGGLVGGQLAPLLVEEGIDPGTVIEDRPMRTRRTRKRTTSPTSTGFLNSTRFMATVTREGGGPPARMTSRCAPMAPAWSM